MDRYKQLRINGMVKSVPFIKLKQKGSDKVETYKLGSTRLDLLSYKYYQDPNYDWLILLANPEYDSLEFNIPDNTNIVIPFPLETSLVQYNTEVSKYLSYYGI
jgi:hypothetical protein